MVDQLPPTRLKEELRAAVLERRGELDQRTVYRDSELMCQRLVRHSVFKEADTIAGYSAIRGEIEPRSALGDALEDGKRVYLPRVVDEHHLEFVQIEGFAGLEEGAFGVLEPQGPAAPLGEIDLFLVPRRRLRPQWRPHRLRARLLRPRARSPTACPGRRAAVFRGRLLRLAGGRREHRG